MTAYYNEYDPKAAAWLRELIKQGHIAPGDVDERSIEGVRPDDLRGYTQCHFFAGIGVWSYALRLAGWPDDRPVWTGSCPCQPFSAAGKGAGFADERHLWPAFHYLIGQCRPPVVFGEQVASKDGLGWLDLVQADLEGSGYASAAVDLCAAGLGAPHIRQRLWWVGERLDNSASARRDGPFGDTEGLARDEARLRVLGTGREDDGVADPSDAASQRNPGTLSGTKAGEHGAGVSVNGRELIRPEYAGASVGAGQPRPVDSFWSDADWLFCRDGKWRPVEPQSFPLAHGAAERVGRLRGYGNAIVAPVAQAFIETYLETDAIRRFRLTEASDLATDTGIFG